MPTQHTPCWRPALVEMPPYVPLAPRAHRDVPCRRICDPPTHTYKLERRAAPLHRQQARERGVAIHEAGAAHVVELVAVVVVGEAACPPSGTARVQRRDEHGIEG